MPVQPSLVRNTARLVPDLRFGCPMARFIRAVLSVVRLAGIVSSICFAISDACAAISVNTGNLFEEVTDYATGGEDRLAFIRYYNSRGAPSYGPAAPLGMNWRSNYDRYLMVLPGGVALVAERAVGQVLTFKRARGLAVPDSDVDVTLVQFGDNWVLRDEQGVVETYGPPDITGRSRVVAIKAPNGYTQTLSYNDRNQLVAVTDSHDRKLEFAYAGWTLSTVTAPNGEVLTYTFDSRPAAQHDRLASVRYSKNPDRDRSYLYEHADFRFSLTGVLDASGKRLATWTYDEFGRCTSSQLADRSSLTTISYDKDSRDYPVNTVTDPLGQKTVYKFDMLQGVAKVVEIDRLASSARPAVTEFFAYDVNGYLIKKTDSNGHVMVYSPQTQYAWP